MNSRKSQTFVGRPAEPGVYYILIKPRKYPDIINPVMVVPKFSMEARTPRRDICRPFPSMISPMPRSSAQQSATILSILFGLHVYPYHETSQPTFSELKIFLDPFPNQSRTVPLIFQSESMVLNDCSGV